MSEKEKKEKYRPIKWSKKHPWLALLFDIKVDKDPDDCGKCDEIIKFKGQEYCRKCGVVIDWSPIPAPVPIPVYSVVIKKPVCQKCGATKFEASDVYCDKDGEKLVLK